MGMQTIEELFEHELGDIYSAEHALLQALDQMARESSDMDIRRAFSQHRKDTQSQIRRLEKIFRMLGRKPDVSTCAGIEGLLKEKKLFMRERPTPELVEFYNVGAGQKVERYEIAAYENLIEMADQLGMAEAVELLEETLQEEDGALNRLRVLASEFEVTEDVDEHVDRAEEDSSPRP